MNSKKLESRQNKIIAKQQGKKYYSSATPCQICNSYEKYVINSSCRNCIVVKGNKKLIDSELMAPYRTKEKKNKWRKNNKDKVKQISDKYNSKDSTKQKLKKYYQQHKNSLRDRDLQKKYNISLNEYNTLLQNQNCVCAICKINKCSSGKAFAVDHSHETGKVRGLLCKNCNLGLGIFKDNPLTLQKASSYLMEHQ